jgi:hypothetical protein
MWQVAARALYVRNINIEDWNFRSKCSLIKFTAIAVAKNRTNTKSILSIRTDNYFENIH